MSLIHIYAAVVGVSPLVLRPVHVGFTLVLVFLLVPARGQRSRLLSGWPDVVCDSARRRDDRARAGRWRRLLGARGAPAARRRVLRRGVPAARRGSLPAHRRLAHRNGDRGRQRPRVHGNGAPLDDAIRRPGHRRGDRAPVPDDGRRFGDAVAASSMLVILFTIFAAFLEQSGAFAFFRDWSLAVTSHEGAETRQAGVLASMLVGCASGSTVAAASAGVSATAGPSEGRDGHDAGGGLVAAAGMGALVTPPVLGRCGTPGRGVPAGSLSRHAVDGLVPAILWYLSLFLMAKIDARKSGLVPEARAAAAANSAAALTRRHGYRAGGIVALVILLAIGYPAVVAVVGAMLVTCATLFFRRDVRGGFRGIAHALRDGALQVLGIAATCAAAGIAIGVAAMTDAASKFSALLVAGMGGSLLSVAALIALGIGAAGLALPVTATCVAARHRCAGARHGRRAGLCRPHVHLLLRGALRTVATPDEPALRRRRGRGRRCAPGKPAHVEVHAARLRGAVRVPARSGRRRAAPKAPSGSVVGARRVDRMLGGRGHRRDCGGRAALAAARV